MKKTQRQKPTLSCALQKRSKTAKVDVERALEMPAPRSGSLSTADFDRSEWEIMYPLFVAEGLVDPSECVNRGGTWRFIITVQLLCALSRIWLYFILPSAFSLVYICAFCLRAGFVPTFCLVRRSSFTCSHLLPPSWHGFPSVFDNSMLASFIKFHITQLVRWFVCLLCRLGSTLWIFILVYARSLLEGLFHPDVLCFRDFKLASGIF
jgi:hypothetical protein